MTYRKRNFDIVGPDVKYTDRRYDPYMNFSERVYTGHTHYTSYIADEVHPGWKNLGSGDVGGFCHLYKTWQEVQLGTVTMDDFSIWLFRGYGQFWPRYFMNPRVQSGEMPPPMHTDQELTGYGATALSRSIPTNPSYGLSRAIGELRNDGLPSMVALQTIKERSKYLKNSGNEYLNVQFGWLPLISDLKGFARSVLETGKTIRQYRRSADVKVRRRYSFPTYETFYQGLEGRVAFAPSDQILGDVGYGNRYVTSRREMQFSGAFIYHIPIGDDFSSKMTRWESEANKLLGLRLTPKLVWDLAPWSWAIDWFTNIGDVINNISRLGADGLVMQYGYFSEVIKTEDRIESWLYLNDNRMSHYSSASLFSKELRRLPAHWYGFGFDVSALSPAQDAVLVALGLTHGLR